MRIGIGSYAFRWAIGTRGFTPNRPLTPSGLVEKAAELGAEVLQICDNLPLDSLPDAALVDLTRCAAKLGLDLEVGVKGSRPEHLRRNLEVAQQLNARLLRVVPTTAEWRPSFSELVSIFKSLLPDLRAAGIVVALENHFHLTPAELARLIKTIDDPLVGACLDPLNSITRLVGVTETIEALAPFTVSVHAKDASITRPRVGFYISGCPLGEGLVDLNGLLNAVGTAGRSPNVVVECWMDRLDDEAATLAREEDWVRRGIAYLRGISSRRFVRERIVRPAGCSL